MEVTTNSCPSCGASKEDVRGVEYGAALPLTRDIRVCVECGTFSVFDELEVLREATRRDLSKLSFCEVEALLLISQAIRAARKELDDGRT
jgi:hypothetical protein